MKILKIELQNINSLKSDIPFVIDFESEKFNDVGLYAITGTTGAGKSTILDAITIAMYHEVPRFNKSHIKAGLQDVISYDAKHALARITFENENIIYEASWSMRIVSKNGKKLSKPDEQVRLKNLTDKKIIAEKKKEFQKKIIEVTKLNYNQFLRSVMLAQGEFASFLSAKSSEKGVLLEQITGEDIYRQIGETLSKKILDEKNTLRDIESNINNDDILPDETLISLTKEKNDCKLQIDANKNEKNRLSIILDWYKSYNKENENKIKYNNDISILDEEKTENKYILNALILNEKAEPFAENINNITSISNNIERYTEELKNIENNFKNTEIQLNTALEENKLTRQIYIDAENTNNIWQKKLEQIATLDANIGTYRVSKNDLDEKNHSLKNNIYTLNEKLSNLKKEIKKQENRILKTNIFLKENESVEKIKPKFTLWLEKLNNIKSLDEKIIEDKELIYSNEKIISDLRKKYTSIGKKIEDKKEVLKVIKNDISTLSHKIKGNSLEKLIDEKDELIRQREVLDKSKTMSEGYQKYFVDKKNISDKITESEKNIDLYERDINSLVSDINTSEGLIKDAEKILNYEKTIKSFEVERNNLKKGKPCNLCGSTTHPYVEKYLKIDISNTEKELYDRKFNREHQQKKYEELTIKITELKTTLKNDKSSISSILKNIDVLENDFSNLNLTCKISDLEKINSEINSIKTKLELCSKTINDTQNNLSKKEKEELKEKQLLQEISEFEASKSTLEGEGKGLRTELEKNKEVLKNSEIDFETQVQHMKKELSTYKLSMPSYKEIPILIDDIQNKIDDFYRKKETLSDEVNKLSTTRNKIASAEEILKTNTEDKKLLDAKIEQINNSIFEKTNERNDILPTEISTETKRNELKNTLAEAKEKYENSNDNIKKLSDENIKTNSDRDNHNKLVEGEKMRLNTLNQRVEIEMKKSDFKRIEDVRNALLTLDKKRKYSEIKKSLDKKTIELNTNLNKVLEALKVLEANKNFEELQENASEDYKILEREGSVLFERIGNIEQQIKKDAEIRDRNKKILKEIEAQKKILKKWDTLHTILGGSKEAFNIYVQRLTLKNLIKLANLHLFKLNKRYSLKINEKFKSGEELNFELVDHFQTNKTRPIDTSSGGEKFLISLALALGLSDLASNNVNINSLFIDEGFGTLDSKMLETVISTLETLQKDNKKIGIISHVDTLKERISRQIQIVKNSNGVSHINII